MTLWSFTLLSVFFPDETEDFVRRLNERLVSNPLKMRAAFVRIAPLAATGLLFAFPSFIVAGAIDVTLVFQGQFPLIVPSILTGAGCALNIELIQMVLAVTKTQTRIVKARNRKTWELHTKSS